MFLCFGLHAIFHLGNVSLQGSISAIIPTFNRSRYLGEAIAALANQTRALDQIIIWDDGSTDGTAEAVQQALSADLNGVLQYFKAENQGKSAALNAAMKHAQGEYIWICDDDDVACPDAAEKLAHILDTDDAGIAAGAHVRFHAGTGGGEKTFTGTGYWPDLSAGSVIRHLLEDIFFFQNASLVRRSCYDAAGPFREDLSRSIDYEMFVRLGTRFPIKVINDILFLQRKHNGVRGPSAQRHTADQSDAVWLESDRKIFSDLRDRLPVSFYAALFKSSAKDLALRAGYLQRGCVYARRCDWGFAIEDFKAAAEISPSEGLSETEVGIVIRSMAGKHGSAMAYCPPVQNQLLALARESPAGRAIVKALGRGSVWRARDALNRRNYMQFLRIAGFCARAGFRPRPALQNAALSETNYLETEAYNW
ncbi:glycosyltransferase family 2 protein [Leisingera aquimarina]|uniref:glycosyltransferase family 2 protein n=1 Tax=Leisingera aquimarina TaxID=476529 RepID=UPI0003FEDCA6|nr:glycosyltransferase family 2 protein [Leisingera aquimarina]